MMLVLLLALVAGSSLEAQSLKVADRGAAMLTRPISSKQELAEAFRNCETSTLLRASCEQFLEAFQIVDPDGAPQSVAQMADYVMDLAVVPCPSGRGILSRIFMPSRRMDHRWPRDFERGEMCLMNNNTNRLVLSMACGNTILSPRTVAMESVDRPREMSLRDVHEIKDTNRITVPKGTRIRGDTNLVLDSSTVITMREPTALVVTTVDTTSLPAVKDSLRVSAVDSARIEGPRIGHRLITRSDTLTAPQSIIFVDVKQKKSGGLWRYVRWPLVILAGGVLYELIDDDGCGCAPSKTGGPQNPPN